MATDIPGIYTTDEAAAFLEIDRTLVCRYCRSGRLPAKKAGRDWIINQRDLIAFKKVPREPGNPDFKRR